jgi:hypothetical protein
MRVSCYREALTAPPVLVIWCVCLPFPSLGIYRRTATSFSPTIDTQYPRPEILIDKISPPTSICPRNVDRALHFDKPITLATEYFGGADNNRAITQGRGWFELTPKLTPL